jgi:hypothetical protein
MNTIDKFLSLDPSERMRIIMENKSNFPHDPYPALRCLASNPDVNFPSLEESVILELRTYTNFLAELGHIDSGDLESWGNNAEKYVLALAVIRVRV